MFIFSVVAHGVYPFAISAISIGKKSPQFLKLKLVIYDKSITY
jgi:hypothetical protein